MDFNDLTPELQAKAKNCKTPEEVLALAREEGYELSDEELEAVSGGWFMECKVFKAECANVKSPRW